MCQPTSVQSMWVSTRAALAHYAQHKHVEVERKVVTPLTTGGRTAMQAAWGSGDLVAVSVPEPTTAKREAIIYQLTNVVARPIVIPQFYAAPI